MTLPVLRLESGLCFPSGSRTKKEALKYYCTRYTSVHQMTCYVAIEMGIAGSALTVWQEAGEELIQWSVFSR